MTMGRLACVLAISVAACVTMPRGEVRAATVPTVLPGPFSTAYQINASHNGSTSFTKPFNAPFKQVWSVTFAGGVSYPIVAQGMVFVSVDNSVTGTPLIVALDLATGKKIWEKASAAGFLAYGDGRLFFTSFDGPLQAFNAKNGAPLWSNQLPGQFYFNFLPIVLNGAVFAGGDESGTTLYKVDAATGLLDWTQLLPGGGQGATAGSSAVFFSTPCNLPSYNANSGAVNWYYSSGCDGGGGGVAAFYRNRVFAPTLNVSGGEILNATTGAIIGPISGGLPAFYGVLSFQATSSGVTATDINSGNLEWQFGTQDTLVGAPIVVNKTVFVASATGKIYALSVFSGKLLQTLSPGVGTAQSSYSTVAGLGAGQGFLVAPTGSVLSAYVP
jgi:outer membrane protein assembly factor BamB